MDLEDIQRRLTRAMAANAEAALLAMHGFPRNDAVCHLCLVAGNELQELMRLVTAASDQQSLLAASAAFEWTDADREDRQKSRDMYAARKKAISK